MYDTEWETIATKLLDKLEGNEDETNENTLEENGSTQLEDNNDESLISSTEEDSNQLSQSVETFEIDGKSDEDIRLKIERLDPKSNLVIYRYLKYKTDDILVAEYCDKLMKLDFAPEEPSNLVVLCYSNGLEKPDLSITCQKNCISMLVSYIKCSQLKRKLKLAELEGAPLFNVSNPYNFENNALFTIAGHERFATLRNCLTIQMQRAATIENQFVMELLLIRVCFAIMQDIKTRKKKFTTDVIMAYFRYLFIIVKYEYACISKHGSESVESNLNPDEDYNMPEFPNWRMDKTDPPMYFNENIASGILDKIQKSETQTFDVAAAVEKLSEIHY